MNRKMFSLLLVSAFGGFAISQVTTHFLSVEPLAANQSKHFDTETASNDSVLATQDLRKTIARLNDDIAFLKQAVAKLNDESRRITKAMIEGSHLSDSQHTEGDKPDEALSDSELERQQQDMIAAKETALIIK